MKSDNKYGFIIPWECDFKSESSFIKLEHTYKHKDFYFNIKDKPFISVINEDCTTRKFIDAVLNKNSDDAKIYMSKNISIACDYEEIESMFKGVSNYKYLVNVFYDKISGCKVNSVLISDKEKKYRDILNIYLINEPDIYSKWKIYKIEKE